MSKGNTCVVYDLTNGASGLSYRAGWLQPFRVTETWHAEALPDSGHPPTAWLTLPQDQVLTRVLTLPAHDDDTIAGLLQHTVRPELPFPENVELRFAWTVIAETAKDNSVHSTVLLAAARQDAVDKAVRDNGGQPDCRIVPAFAPLFNLFVARFPAKSDRVYALLHLTPRTSFVIVCRNRELLGVQNLSGLAMRADANEAMSEDEVTALCGRLAPLLHRTMHSLETEQKLPRIDEVVLSAVCPLPPALLTSLADKLGIPAVAWPDFGVPAGHLLALGLAEMAATPTREGTHLFEFARPDRPASMAGPAPLTALRFACHGIILVLLFLSLQMVLREHIQVARAETEAMSKELVTLQPAIAAGRTLFSDNEELLRQLGRERRSLLPDYATVVARLGEVTPADVSLEQVTIGGEAAPAPVQASVATGALRRIGTTGDTGTLTTTSPRVVISGVANDALAFARYCQRLEQARILSDVACQHAEMTADGAFSFALAGTL